MSMQTALTLLFADMDHKTIAGHLQTYLKGTKEFWCVLRDFDEAEQVARLCGLSVDCVLEYLAEETGGTYTGTRERIWGYVRATELPNCWYEHMNDIKQQILEELKDEITPYEHKDGCPCHAHGSSFYECTCEAEEAIQTAA